MGKEERETVDASSERPLVDSQHIPNSQTAINNQDGEEEKSCVEAAKQKLKSQETFVVLESRLKAKLSQYACVCASS